MNKKYISIEEKYYIKEDIMHSFIYPTFRCKSEYLNLVSKICPKKFLDLLNLTNVTHIIASEGYIYK